MQCSNTLRNDLTTRAGDLSEHAFYILKGAMTITDTKEASRNPVIKRVQCDQWFGDEEAMSSVRRALTAAACENPTIVLKVPTDEFEACMESLVQDFESKIEFIASLPPFKPLLKEDVRRLAPYFNLLEFKQKEVVVWQGDHADSMYLIKEGVCSVVVDPLFKAAGSPDGQRGRVEKGQAMHLCNLGEKAIIGDMAVLPGTVVKRAASCIASSNIKVYRIGRSLLIRSLPPEQLEVLRRIASAKIAMTESSVGQPSSGSLAGQVLQGRNLRQLLEVEQSRKKKAPALPMGHSEEYFKLVKGTPHTHLVPQPGSVQTYTPVPQMIVMLPAQPTPTGGPVESLRIVYPDHWRLIPDDLESVMEEEQPDQTSADIESPSQPRDSMSTADHAVEEAIDKTATSSTAVDNLAIPFGVSSSSTSPRIMSARRQLVYGRPEAGGGGISLMSGTASGGLGLRSAASPNSIRPFSTSRGTAILSHPLVRNSSAFDQLISKGDGMQDKSSDAQPSQPSQTANSFVQQKQQIHAGSHPGSAAVLRAMSHSFGGVPGVDYTFATNGGLQPLWRQVHVPGSSGFSSSPFSHIVTLKTVPDPNQTPPSLRAERSGVSSVVTHTHPNSHEDGRNSRPASGRMVQCGGMSAPELKLNVPLTHPLLHPKPSSKNVHKILMRQESTRLGLGPVALMGGHGMITEEKGRGYANKVIRAQDSREGSELTSEETGNTLNTGTRSVNKLESSRHFRPTIKKSMLIRG
ncbi:hypothetical protein CEUSTIGMA_g2379.t1 [Chlamydomonas eustigma]|uniref:Cyclic nucleotide-binding domain-containing protein n=1 Tax=Chlamydomonas eustigma TaxID=1157962 RepID=A0A250WVQ9_9CHLO|nr:hypothetical protein CEUSTIGMA_g2379.t1 [Chlamydomonas eustigma]|eukprot:GAX74933.1 hypothetical protein CEUSTIGMA_g2379.t1 [Chlamydomonas eustigma]